MRTDALILFLLRYSFQLLSFWDQRQLWQVMTKQFVVCFHNAVLDGSKLEGLKLEGSKLEGSKLDGSKWGESLWQFNRLHSGATLLSPLLPKINKTKY